MTVLLRTAEVSDQTGIPVATLRWWRTPWRGATVFQARQENRGLSG